MRDREEEEGKRKRGGVIDKKGEENDLKENSSP